MSFEGLRRMIKQLGEALVKGIFEGGPRILNGIEIGWLRRPYHNRNLIFIKEIKDSSGRMTWSVVLRKEVSVLSRYLNCSGSSGGSSKSSIRRIDLPSGGSKPHNSGRIHEFTAWCGYPLCGQTIHPEFTTNSHQTHNSDWIHTIFQGIVLNYINYDCKIQCNEVNI